MPSFFPYVGDTDRSGTVKLYIQEMQQYIRNLLILESLIPVLILNYSYFFKQQTLQHTKGSSMFTSVIFH